MIICSYSAPNEHPAPGMLTARVRALLCRSSQVRAAPRSASEGLAISREAMYEMCAEERRSPPVGSVSVGGGGGVNGVKAKGRWRNEVGEG